MLKFLACASALAIAAPATAQITEVDTPAPEETMTAPVTPEAQVAADAVADPAMDAPSTEMPLAAPAPAPAAETEMTVQTEAPSSTPMETDASTASQPMETEPMETEPMETPAEPDGTVTATGPSAAATTSETAAVEAAQEEPTNDRADVASFVAEEFPNRDADGDGVLSQAEFASWILPIYSAQAEGEQTQAELDAWAGAAFAQADTDSSADLSQAEMAVFLVG